MTISGGSSKKPPRSHGGRWHCWRKSVARSAARMRRRISSYHMQAVAAALAAVAALVPIHRSAQPVPVPVPRPVPVPVRPPVPGAAVAGPGLPRRTASRCGLPEQDFPPRPPIAPPAGPPQALGFRCVHPAWRRVAP